MLQDLIAHHIANGLAEFEGLHIEGTVPVKQELINAVIADVLANGLPAPSSSTGGGPVTDAPRPAAALDPKAVQALVQTLVKRAEITAENGAITLHFEVRR
jgi:hypothetical protein